MAGETLKLQAKPVPGFLAKISQFEWEVNGKVVTPATPTELTVDAASSLPGQIVNVTVRGVASQNTDVRRALVDIWGISQLNSSEQRFEKSLQIEVVPSQELGEEQAGVRKYLAALGTYIAETFLYLLQMFLSGAVLLFILAVVRGIVPDRETGR